MYSVSYFKIHYVSFEELLMTMCVVENFEWVIANENGMS